MYQINPKRLRSALYILRSQTPTLPLKSKCRADLQPSWDLSRYGALYTCLHYTIANNAVSSAGQFIGIKSDGNQKDIDYYWYCVSTIENSALPGVLQWIPAIKWPDGTVLGIAKYHYQGQYTSAEGCIIDDIIPSGIDFGIWLYTSQPSGTIDVNIIAQPFLTE